MSDPKWQEYYVKKRLLEKQCDFASLRKLLDQRYGENSSERHAQECAVLWREGRKQDALNEVIIRLHGSEYTVNHIILAASYALYLQDHNAAEFLEKEFNSRFDEFDSIKFVNYVYRKLNDLSITASLELAAKMLNYS